MKILVATGLIATVFTAGCGAQLNPMTWFGNDEETIAEAPTEVVQDGRPLVQEVTQLRIEQITAGAIVRATGVSETQGYWDAELVPTNLGELKDGELIFEFRLRPPPGPIEAGPPRARNIVVAIDLSQVELREVRRITVIGASNRRSVRR